MEYWENSYSSWNWYNEVLEHGNGGSIFEADEEQKEETPQEGNKDGGEQQAETPKEDNSAENESGENVEDEENYKNEETKNTENKDPLEEQFLGKPIDDIQLQGEAGEYLIKLHDAIKNSADNLGELAWGSHPDNIAAQLKYLFPDSDGSWPVWDPVYKDTKKYNSKNVGDVYGLSGNYEGFKFEEDTMCDENGNYCSSRLLLNDKENPIKNVFDFDADKLQELAKSANFDSAVNIDVLGLALLDSGSRAYDAMRKKMEKNHGFSGTNTIKKNYSKSESYPKVLFRKIKKEGFEYINDMVKKDSSDNKGIKAIESFIKNNENVKETSSFEKGDKKFKLASLHKNAKDVIENIVSGGGVGRFYTFEQGDTFEQSDVPNRIVESLYDIKCIAVAKNSDNNDFNIYIVYTKKSGLEFETIPSYKGKDSVEHDEKTKLILITSSANGPWGGSKWGVEISSQLYKKIFDDNEDSTELSTAIDLLKESIQDSVNTPSPDYLSPLAGLNLSEIRRELMESSAFDGLLEAALDNYNLDKGLPKFDKKRGKLTYLTKADYKNKVGAVTYKGIRQEQKTGAARTMWLVQSKSDPSKTYTVQIDIEVPGKGGLFAIAKKYGTKKKKGEIRNITADRKLLRTSNLRLYCDCPDFHFSGAEHNLNKKGELILNPDTGGVNPGKRFAYTTKGGKSYVDTYPTTVAPAKRDPNGVKDRCKHIHAALLEFRRKIPTIFMDARKIEDVDLEKVSSFREDVDTAAQSPDIQADTQGALNDLANMIQPDTTEQTQAEPIETAESNEEETQPEQTEEQNEETSMVAEENPEEYPAEPEGESEQTEEPEQEEQPAEQEHEEEPDHFADTGNMMDEDETVDKLEEEKNKKKSLSDRIKDGLKDFGSKIKNVTRRFFRHEDCELAGQLIERVLESDDPRVIQESVSQIAKLLEANGKHDYAKTLLEGVYERPGRRTK